MTKKILLDTNFLVAPFQLSITIFGELDRLYPVNSIYTLDDAVQEAKSIEGGKYGKLVEKLIETQDIKVLETEGEGSVDDLLVDISDEFAVATNDKELKERLVDEGKEVVIIRGGNHLEAVNGNRL
ncbi:PIN domain-containing protein [Candidatus Nanosalina sp. VS9-1]|uniref:type II toxin-antitoxin system VapC family toxin n=1 Tax=Candidatus Nanosalina sp. VS9-1 TaxID=3388566 RepID=UPI0039DFE93C